MQRVLPTLLAALLLASACSSSGGDDDGSAVSRPGVTPTPEGWTPVPIPTGSAGSDGLSIQLSSGSPAGPSLEGIERIAVVNGVPLSADRVEQIFARAAALEADNNDQTDFKRPAQTLRPPTIGEIIEQPFPPEPKPLDVAVVSEPLEVVRAQPEGAVPVAPFVSITFNQPMVPLATLDQLDDREVPASISPAVEGQWQWIGTRTLQFNVPADQRDRLPMATEYTITVPSGTTGVGGTPLAQNFTQTFTTAGVSVAQTTRAGEDDLQPVFGIRFSGGIDPDAVLAVISMDRGAESVPLRLATDAEIEADSGVARLRELAPKDHFVAVRPVSPLAKDSVFKLKIGPEIPSVEGPLRSTESHTVEHKTYGPLRIRDVGCGWGDEQCAPLSDFRINLSNPIESFDQSLVSIEPALPGAVIKGEGASIWIQGAKKADTNYTVTLSADLTDTYGQKISGNREAKFAVGKARPVLVSFPKSFITTDPYAPVPAVQMVTVNHQEIRVRGYAVEPEDFDVFERFRSDIRGSERPTAPGELVLDETLDVSGDNIGVATTLIALDEAVGEFGHLVLVVDSVKQFSEDDRDAWANRPQAVWVQVTSLGLDVVSDGRRHVAWVTDLSTGKAVEGAVVEFDSTENVSITDGNGIAELSRSSRLRRAIVRHEGQTAFLTDQMAGYHDDYRFEAGGGFFSGGWPTFAADQYRWFVFDDRGLYKPGETVRVKGWTRQLAFSDDSSLKVLPSTDLRYVVRDAAGAELATGTATTSSTGGFDLSFQVPLGANLGPALVAIDGSPAGPFNHAFQIQEFRRPEFEVVTELAATGPYIGDGAVAVDAQADYFAGGALPNTPLEWTVTTRSATFVPPNFSAYSFGEWTPWWGRYSSGPGEPDDENLTERFSASTDAAGQHRLNVDVNGLAQRPLQITAQAEVLDVNRQGFASSTPFLVHPAASYVGLRSAAYVVDPGEEMEVDVIVAGIEGDVVEGAPVEVTASRLDWQRIDGEWTEGRIELGKCEVASAREPVTCTFVPADSGSYLVEAVVTDEAGRSQLTTIRRWVRGGASLPTADGVEREEAVLIPDQESYQPGDTATVFVQAPFESGDGLLITERGGIKSVEAFTLTDGAAALDVKITDRDVPNVWVRVELTGSAPRLPLVDGQPARPAFAGATLRLSVPPAGRTLKVVASPRNTSVVPGQSTAIDLAISDATGAPVRNAEMAVVVVDEAVLALTDYELRDPLDVFYALVPPLTGSVYGRDSLLLADPAALMDQLKGGAGTTTPATTTTILRDSYSGDEEMGADFSMAEGAEDLAYDRAAAPPEGGGGVIEVRQNFDALAAFVPEVFTDSNGLASVPITLPDNLTRYRVMVVAVSGATQFGSGEASLTASRPLMVRPSAPRFANFGDTFEFPMVLQNQTDSALVADVALRTTNLAVGIDSLSAGQTVRVPANDRVEVRFPVSVEEAGTARYQVVVVSGELTDAAQGSLPVYTPATTEAFATYGVIDSGSGIGPIGPDGTAAATGDGAVMQTVGPIEGVYPQFGGLEISTSSTAVQSLTDSMIYLSDYQYRSSDAYASRIIAIASLRDVLEAFESPQLPSAARLNEQVAADLDELRKLQNSDGSFSTWEGSRDRSPYRSVQAAHALTVAKANGYDVNESVLRNALQYTSGIQWEINPAFSYHRFLQAYALHVRFLNGDRSQAEAEELFADGDIGPDALAFIWPIVGSDTAAEIERQLTNLAVVDARTAAYRVNYGDDDYLIIHSNTRTDAIVLDGYLRMDPTSDLVPKIVAGISGTREQGRWRNVQENSFVLLAMNSYFDTFEATTPDFVARAWLGDSYVSEHAFEGRSTATQSTLVPMATLLEDGSDLVVAKDGAGRLYYRLGLRYAPTDLTLDARDRGFVVQRRYEGVDDPNAVIYLADGSVQVKAGAKVRVTLTMVADQRRTDVALVDSLPAGLEILNPELASTASEPREPVLYEDGSYGGEVFDDWGWGWGNWYNHQNLRDDRAEVFATYLWGGTHTYSYIARATTPGTFVVPPAKAEQIYAPEVFGRSASATLIVID